MASTWGSLTWSSNSWGSINNTISVTGIGASASLGNETTQANSDAAVTGIALTGSVNDIADIVIATTGDPAGIAMTNSLGTADAGPDAMVTGLSTASLSLGTLDAFNIEGWGRRTWNSFAWGIGGTLEVSGEAATANIGSLTTTADANVIPTGIAMTASQGDESIQIATEVFLQNNPLPDISANLGTADAGPDAMVVGLDPATVSVGSVEAYNLEGWGRYFWGQFEWGATGEWDFVTPTGQALTSSLGEETITGDANVDLTGIPMTAAEGIVDPSPDATVVGIGMTASLAVGTVVVGEANVTVLGQGISMGLGVGTLDAQSFIDVTGISMSANINGVTTTGSAAVPLTGIELTSTLNSANTLIWNEINTGSTAIWTEVPTRAA